MKPNWTVLCSIVSPEDSAYVGTSWEFFTLETHAQACYSRHALLGNNATMRPYHDNDYVHLSAAHKWGNQIEHTPPNYGRWHHGNGVLCVGSIRVAREDFDTNPTNKIKDEIFDWMCKTLNGVETKKPTYVAQPVVAGQAYNMISHKLLDIVWTALTQYSYPSTYDAPRISGTLGGSMRGPEPTGQALTEWANYALREIRKEVPYES